MEVPTPSLRLRGRLPPSPAATTMLTRVGTMPTLTQCQCHLRPPPPPKITSTHTHTHTQECTDCPVGHHGNERRRVYSTVPWLSISNRGLMSTAQGDFCSCFCVCVCVYVCVCVCVCFIIFILYECVCTSIDLLPFIYMNQSRHIFSSIGFMRTFINIMLPL